MNFLAKLKTVLEMIKFEHSVFALPFALTGAMLAVRESGLPWATTAGKFGWIVVAMVAARSAAMAFNRVADGDIDALNPRTKVRAIPAGMVTKSFTWGFIVFWSGVLVLAAYMLNPLCLQAVPGGAGGGAGILLHQALHGPVASGTRLRARYRALRRLDCDPRHPGPADSPAHRRRDVLDGRL